MKKQLFLIGALVIAAIALAVFIIARSQAEVPASFDGNRAYQHVENQVALGPRFMGSHGHADVIQYIISSLNTTGWEVEIQQISKSGIEIQNIIASRGDSDPQVIIGAHYDTRQFADQDSDAGRRAQPVPGANDGASGVAVLLELARVIPTSSQGVELVFFDAEDQGGINGQDWILGSTAFVGELPPEQVKPKAVIVVDMVGDAEQQLYFEKSSDATLRGQIWAAAIALGYIDRFIPTEKYNILDDHTPFLQAGIPAVDIIDFDYPAWHTTEDIPSKVSPQSLEAVGATILEWLRNYSR
jgi:glutaminyl-peptide cyclotransferase